MCCRGDTATVSTAVLGSPRPAGITATHHPQRDGNWYGAVLRRDICRASVVLFPPRRRSAPRPSWTCNSRTPMSGDTIARRVPAAEPDPADRTRSCHPTRSCPRNPRSCRPTRSASPGGRAAPGRRCQFPAARRSCRPTTASCSSFTFDFSALSSPSVLPARRHGVRGDPELLLPGFGTPVDAATLNVAKAGRAIPLKWQVFDENVAPVLDLDPASSRSPRSRLPVTPPAARAIPSRSTRRARRASSTSATACTSSTGSRRRTTRAVAGGCASTSASAIPDGSVFYRTADFQFTR